MGNGSLPPSGNIHDIRVPVPGTSASEFEVKDTRKKKKGEDKNINWNLQVWFTVVQIKRQKILRNNHSLSIELEDIISSSVES